MPHHLRASRWRPAAITAAVLACFPAPGRAENAAETMELPNIEVVGTTPLPGIGTLIRDVPANVQIHQGQEITRQRQSNITEYLEQNPTSVTINSAQGNPYQPDLSFRGFTASPLLGVPQGLSVFQDGVRINEPFGDTVNWDLLPQSAISSLQLVPGSNPAYGLNTLGGAVAIYTKSGTQYPGGSLSLSGGSWDRHAMEFEHGGKRDEWDYFVTGNFSEDRGWADHNPSRVRQLFGKIGYQTERTDVDVSLTAANNALQGTQTLPRSMLGNYRQAYTFPDLNQNELAFLNVKGSHFFTDELLIGGNLYLRRYRNDSVASNVNGNFGGVDPVSGAVDTTQATNDRSKIDQDSWGFGLQLTRLGELAGHKNQFTVGVSGDFGSAKFTQEDQPAQFTATRDTVGTGAFSQSTDADLSNRYYGVYFTDTLNLDKRWTLTLSGRYNRAEVKIEDRSGTAPGLNGDHTFSRFNPGVGLNFNPTETVTAYGSYTEGMRAPTPIELTCADPSAPCKLPNNFLADPPLKKVVAKTVETGLRGKVNEKWNWNAAAYRTELDDDIQFISAGGAAVNSGYFQNVGKTRRQGLELGVARKFDKLGVAIHYSYIDATYRTGFTENSPANSSANGSGDIHVQPGNHIPGIPQHSLRLRLDYDFDDRWTAGANVVANSGTYARGDENNQDVNGRIAGYTVVNLDARCKVAKDWEFFARVNNLFDRRYANFGILGTNFFSGPGNTFDGANTVNEQFLGLGAPRGIWVGVRYNWL